MSLIDQVTSSTETSLIACEQDKNYDQFPLAFMISDMMIPFDVYIKVLDINKIPFYLSCCQKGYIFEAKWVRKLQELKIQNLYYNIKDEDIYINYMFEIFNKKKKENTTNKEIGSYLCDMTGHWIKYFMRSLPDDLDRGMNLVNEIFDTINIEKSNIQYILELWKSTYCLYKHSVNTLIITLGMLNYLKIKEQFIKRIGLGVLLHDIGMTQIPITIANLPRKLNEKEKTVVKKHPKIGCKLLENYRLVDKECLAMIMQHHENCDGSGYPYNLTSNEISYCGKILRVTDSFASLASPRPWRRAYNPKEAINYMKTEWEERKIYDKEILKTFIQFTADI
jgi:HD-GYP domain-containing protein (c-di-GMP phosphodiesterase class II)